MISSNLIFSLILSLLENESGEGKDDETEGAKDKEETLWTELVIDRFSNQTNNEGKDPLSEEAETKTNSWEEFFAVGTNGATKS
jgi:hypothetical protein